jgi:hypothetical protein
VLDRSSDLRVIGGGPEYRPYQFDKSSRLHARAISEVLAVIKGHRMAAPSAVNPSAANRRPRLAREAA